MATGTLVVGMPLWFSVLPEDPWRAENTLDDFVTRTGLGLEQITQEQLRRRDCPFRNVIVVWDTTPQALREWRKGRSAEYEDAANASLENPMTVSMVGVLSDALEEAISEMAISESDAPSMGFHIGVKTRKTASGKGPYPKLVKALGKVVHEHDENAIGLRAILKWRIALTLCKLLCFLRIHGLEGLERWIARRFSVSHAWRRRTVRRKARRFYRESRRRGRVLNRQLKLEREILAKATAWFARETGSESSISRFKASRFRRTASPGPAPPAG